MAAGILDHHASFDAFHLVFSDLHAQTDPLHGSPLAATLTVLLDTALDWRLVELHRPPVRLASTTDSDDTDRNGTDRRMSLRERRLVNNIETSDIPFHKSNFRNITGADLAVEIDWQEWAGDHDGLLNLNGYVLQQFTDSLNRIGLDAVAKQALGEGLHTLRVQRVDDPADRAIALKGGVLILRVHPAAGWDGTVGSGEIKEFLLDNL